MSKVDELLVPDRTAESDHLRPRAALATLGKGGVVLLAVWTIAGLLLMWWLDDGPVGDADRDINVWLEERRTPTRDTVSHIGSMLSDTVTKVALVVVVGAAMYLLWRRWLEPAFLAVGVLFEASIFVVASFIVGRDRPPVEQLDAPAPSGSFPSGHTAAAVVFYGSVWMIARWHTDHRLIRGALAVVAVLAPPVVAVARVYRGMHHPIDVVAGLLLGIASLVIVRTAVAEYLRDAGGPPWSHSCPDPDDDDTSEVIA